MTQTFFSVVIPTYNRASFIGKSLGSVLKQSYPHFEVIVADDGSDDDTANIVSNHDDKRVRYLYHPNHGVSYARNRALEISRGEFIAFLDSDDRWTGDKLERTADNIMASPGIKIFHTEEIWFKNGKLLPQKDKHTKPTGYVYKNALPLCCISISTAVIHREVFDKTGLFDENLEACEDYDFWLRATSRYEVKLIPESLTIKDGGRKDQLSSSVWGLDRFRIKALVKMLESGILNTENRRLTLEELEKKCLIFAAGSEKRGKSDEAEYYRKLPEKYLR